ncbi:hypothetical protein DTO271G3_4711 [Paecilomyces variotii]|nr:hypothetical protein DTO271G3_4711 [Paecilomyces variotii]
MLCLSSDRTQLTQATNYSAQPATRANTMNRALEELVLVLLRRTSTGKWVGSYYLLLILLLRTRSTEYYYDYYYYYYDEKISDDYLCASPSTLVRRDYLRTRVPQMEHTGARI